MEAAEGGVDGVDVDTAKHLVLEAAYQAEEKTGFKESIDTASPC